MTRVYYAIPTAAPVAQARRCLEAWRDMGYGTAIIIVDDRERRKLPADLIATYPEYPGYGKAVNAITRRVLAEHPECQIVVTAGDDVYPDENRRADEIAEQFIAHFGGTLGVMQPCGDEWHHRGKDGSYKPDIAAWSPWLGREWCERAFMGHGPVCGGFFHYYTDVNLKDVAEWLGVFWQPPDVIHRNENWKRFEGRKRPDYLRKPASMKRFDRALAEDLRSQGYPGCGLL